MKATFPIIGVLSVVLSCADALAQVKENRVDPGNGSSVYIGGGVGHVAPSRSNLTAIIPVVGSLRPSSERVEPGGMYEASTSIQPAEWLGVDLTYLTNELTARLVPNSDPEFTTVDNRKVKLSEIFGALRFRVGDATLWRTSVRYGKLGGTRPLPLDTGYNLPFNELASVEGQFETWEGEQLAVASELWFGGTGAHYEPAGIGLGVGKDAGGHYRSPDTFLQLACEYGRSVAPLRDLSRVDQVQHALLLAGILRDAGMNRYASEGLSPFVALRLGVGFGRFEAREAGARFGDDTGTAFAMDLGLGASFVFAKEELSHWFLRGSHDIRSIEYGSLDSPSVRVLVVRSMVYLGTMQ